MCVRLHVYGADLYLPASRLPSFVSVERKQKYPNRKDKLITTHICTQTNRSFLTFPSILASLTLGISLTLLLYYTYLSTHTNLVRLTYATTHAHPRRGGSERNSKKKKRINLNGVALRVCCCLADPLYSVVCGFCANFCAYLPVKWHSSRDWWHSTSGHVASLPPRILFSINVHTRKTVISVWYDAISTFHIVNRHVIVGLFHTRKQRVSDRQNAVKWIRQNRLILFILTQQSAVSNDYDIPSSSEAEPHIAYIRIYFHNSNSLYTQLYASLCTNIKMVNLAGIFLRNSANSAVTLNLRTVLNRACSHELIQIRF